MNHQKELNNRAEPTKYADGFGQFSIITYARRRRVSHFFFTRLVYCFSIGAKGADVSNRLALFDGDTSSFLELFPLPVSAHKQ